MFLSKNSVRRVPEESLSTETQGCCKASATSGSDIPNTAHEVNALSAINKSNSDLSDLYSRPEPHLKAVSLNCFSS